MGDWEMIDRPRRNVLGVLVNVVDYDGVVERVAEAASVGKSLSITPAASHAVMTGYLDSEQRYRLNHLDLVVPDGQPVRFALRWIYGERLPDRVYGPDLMLRLCGCAESEGWPIYLFGSSKQVLDKLVKSLGRRFPKLLIAGSEPSAFRALSREERSQLVRRVKESRARLLFVGLGCPRQETWIYEYQSLLAMPLIAVGAAFDFLAGTTKQAPPWMQRFGLEWSYRLISDPRRLWRRYLILGSRYAFLLLLQKLGLKKYETQGRLPTQESNFG